jgi:hypothetical protein
MCSSSRWKCLEGEVRDIVGRWAEHVIFTLHVARLGVGLRYRARWAW